MSKENMIKVWRVTKFVAKNSNEKAKIEKFEK